MALLLQLHTFKLDSEVAVDARDYIIDHYSIDLTGYVVVIGYRADDSYFQYAESFVSNTLPLRSLNKACLLYTSRVKVVAVDKTVCVLFAGPLTSHFIDAGTVEAVSYTHLDISYYFLIKIFDFNQEGIA